MSNTDYMSWDIKQADEFKRMINSLAVEVSKLRLALEQIENTEDRGEIWNITRKALENETIEIEDYQAHVVTYVFCKQCGHKAISVHHPTAKYPVQCSKCDQMSMFDENHYLEENKRLKFSLLKAFEIIKEGKRKFAPNTTNSIVDDWLKDNQELGSGK